MDLKKIFTPAAVAANWTAAHEGVPPYFGEALFPAKKKAGLDLKWIKGSKGLPVSLAPSTFDAKAKYRDRIGVKAMETEMPFFREGYKIKEKDRQELLRALDSNDPYARTVLEQIFDDTQGLIDGARVVPERMIWQLLAPTGGNPKIAITANGVAYEYNYDPNNTFKTNNFITVSTNKWNVPASADPISDIRDAQNKIEDATGVKPTVMVLSRKTMNYILAADKVKSAVLAQNVTANVVMTDEAVKAVFLALLGITVVVYSKKFQAEDGTATAFYPDDMVTLLPEGTIGSTWYGTTPEEADLMGTSSAEVAIVNTGVAITRVITPHPVQIDTYASEIVLPSFERMDEVAVLKVV